MTLEDRLLFACIRPYPDAESISALSHNPKIRWSVLHATAVQHGVAPLVYSTLQQCTSALACIPEDVAAQFEIDLYGNVVEKEQLMGTIAEALAYLNRQHLDVMLAKGAALDVLVYPHPWYTVLNDVDLIFRRRRTEMTDSAALEFLDRLRERGVQFEYDFFEHHDITMNGMLSIDFQAIWANASEVQFRDSTVWVMSPEDLLVATCINSCRKRFFRLKSLRDIAEILTQYRELNWETLRRNVEAYGCGGLVYAALLSARTTVGCAIPDTVLAGLGVGLVRRAMIGFLIQKQSFTSLTNLYAGRKVLGRKVGWGLLLPYMTFGPRHWLRRMRYLLAGAPGSAT